jgi:lactoylglutathione lyase
VLVPASEGMSPGESYTFGTLSTRSPELRLEVFPTDLDRFVDFYVGLLRFELVADRRGESSPYVAVPRGAVRIGAARAWEPVNAAVRAVPHGVEMVFEVDDLQAERDAVVAAGVQLAADIVQRPWGLTESPGARGSSRRRRVVDESRRVASPLRIVEADLAPT